VEERVRDLFLAAGLLRLAAGPDLKMLAIVALIIVVRRITVIGVKAAARAFGGMPGMRLRA
jgi:hypothetical protein